MSTRRRPTLAETRRSLRRTAGAAVPGTDGIRPVADRTGLALSYNQEQQWFLHRWEPSRSEYNATVPVRLRGPLDVTALTRALRTIVGRHEILRTCYGEEDGTPYQIVNPSGGPDLRVVDATGRDEESVTELVAGLGNEPFDLDRGPVVRATLVRTAPEDHVLVLVVHHIAFDGASLTILVEELVACYAAAAAGTAPVLREVPVQYGDFAAWQRGAPAEKLMADQLGYWRGRLAGASVPVFPADRPRPARPSGAGAAHSLFLPARLADDLAVLAKDHRVSPLSVYLAGFNALLAAYTGQDDLCVGSVFSGRTRRETDRLIGYFANTLVLRTSAAGNPTFGELLRRTHETVLGAHLNQDVPFHRLVKELGITRRPGRNPLFDVCFTMHHAIAESVRVGDIEVGAFSLPRRTSQFDLTVEITEVIGEGVCLWAEYSTDLFDAERIERLCDDYLRVLTAMAASPQSRIGAGREPRLLHELFEARAAEQPDAPALRTPDRTVTYAELDAAANALAAALREHGTGPDLPVAVLLDPGAELTTAALAIMKSGSAYLPLDPLHPRERWADVLRQTGCRVVVAPAARARELPASVTVIEPDRRDAAGGALPCPARPGNLAYVIFTSGSTGQPKGVLIEHAAAVNFVRGTPGRLAPDPRDRVVQFTSPAFDVSVYEMFVTLAGGGCLVSAPRSVLLDPRALAALMRRERVSVFLSTPATLSLLDGYDLPDLRKLSIGGEAPSRDLVRRWRADGRVIQNGYGPAETTVEASCGILDDRDWDELPSIGSERAGYRIHILDEHGVPVPDGTAGELHITGAGLARGYLGRPGLTAERFLPDPFGPPGTRMYRTGDLARRRGERLQILGRTDRQVKIRGHRVEPGEIEAVLADHPDIAQVTVEVTDRGNGDKDLVAHVVPAAGEAPTVAAVRSFLRDKLPPVMIPSRVVAVPAMPVTVGGKVDRARLTAGPARTLAEVFERQAARTPRAPAVTDGSGERTFAELDAHAGRLARVLRRHGVGPEDIVAVAAGKTADTVAVLLAVLKAGATYLPIAEDAPAHRCGLVLTDAAPRLLVHSRGARAAAGAADAEGVPRLCLDGLATDGEDSGPLGLRVDPAQRAYILYTSGTTGRPNGVAVEHRSVVSLFHSHSRNVFGPGAGGRRLRVALSAPLGFDASWCGLLWMLAGHHLHLVDDTVLGDTGAFLTTVEKHRIDVVDVTPTYCGHLLNAGLFAPGRHRPGVVLLGGEAVPEPLWRRLRALTGVRAFNLYGPTECTVDMLVCGLHASETPAIGTPVDGAGLRVLDADLDPVEDGATGELYAVGACLARGYHGRPGLTASRFLPDPLGGTGARMYRTGDLGRRRADGLVEFLGRADEQVKISGFRVELGDVAAALADHPDVVQSAAHIVAGGQLYGFVVPGPDRTVDPAAVRRHAADRLPSHAVPAGVVVLRELPLTANGKLDRTRLPAPGARAASRAPRTPREEILCAVFADVLGVSEVGIDDGFFERGGHSLLATRLVSRVRKALGVELPLRVLFESPTVAELGPRLAEAGEPGPELRPVPRLGAVPLSYAQRRLWFLAEMEPDSPAYNMPIAVRLSGELDVTALREALADVVRRHESLRTVFPAEAGEPYQRVLDRTPDLLARTATEPELADRLAEAAAAPFDLHADIPLRAHLFALGAREHVLLLVLHHIACDGASMGALISDTADAYAARRGGGADGLPPLPLQYADYTYWQRESLGDESDPGSRMSRQLGHWRQALDGLPEELALPADRPRPVRPTGRGGTVPLSIDPALHRALSRVAKGNRSTLFQVMQAALAALYTRLGAGEDIAVGVPTTGRDDPRLDPLVGFFVNTLVLRTDTSGDPSFTGLLERVKAAALDAYANADVPFERVVDQLAPVRSASRHPLVQTMIAFDQFPDGTLDVEGLTMRWEQTEVAAPKFDLLFNVRAHGEHGEAAGIDLGLQYNADLYDRVTVERIGARYLAVLAAVAETPDVRIGALPVLDPAERDRVLREWNDTCRPVPPRTLPELIEAQVERTPDAEAVDGCLTYAGLNTRANRLARWLIERGAGPESAVGLALPRSPELVVAVVAVLKAGAAYLPIDQEHPPERIALLSSRADLVLTALPPDLAAFSGDDVTDRERTAPLLPAHPAFVVHTSGSTGVPKGVVMPGSALVNLLSWHADRLPGGPGTRTAQTAASGFDVFAQEVLSALTTGQCLVIPERDLRLEPEAMRAWLREQRVSRYFAPNAVIEAVAEAPGEGPPEPVDVVQAGEALVMTDAMERLRTRVRVHNHYGPTETHVVTTYTLPAADERSAPLPPIGRPVWNVRCYVLDSGLRPVPAGVTGELYVAGAQLARGYLRQPGHTAASFVPDPFGGPGERMYRTGDLARWTRSGDLEYLGRADRQISLRGFRIEPGEIEAALSRHSSVRQTVVRVRGGRLIAYVVPEAGEVDTESLREHVASIVPRHLVPSAYVPLDALPLSRNGKVDLGALPDPPSADGATGERARTQREEILCGLIADVLGIGTAGPHDDFFQSGGHSLLVAVLVRRIRTAFGTDLPVRAVFDAPTAAGLARLLERAARTGTGKPAVPPLTRRPAGEPAPLSYAQQRIWFVERLGSADDAFHIPCTLRLTGDLDVPALRRSITRLMRRHEVLRTVCEERDGVPWAEVAEVPEDVLPTVRVTEDDIAARSRQEHAVPFDLARDVPVRWLLMRVGPGEHVLVVTLHHIAGDGLSLRVLTRELTEMYRAGGSGAELPVLPVQYADYAHWQRRLPLAEQLAGWRADLADAPLLELPTDRPRPRVQTFTGGRVHAELSAACAERLRALGRPAGATLFMTLLAAFQLLLGRAAGQRDVVVGTPVSGRHHTEVAELVGCFLNMLPLRTDLSGNPGFRDLLDRVRDHVLEAFDRQDVPFEQIVEAVAPERDPGRQPLFQVMLNMLPGAASEDGPADVTVTAELPDAADGTASKLDLTLYVDDQGPGLSFALVHNTDLFLPERVERLLGQYVTLLEQIAADPDRPVEEYRLQLPAAGAARTAPALPRRAEHAVHHLIEARADRAPEAVALVDAAGTWTYRDLDERANALAVELSGAGVRPGERVAVHGPRSAALVGATVGVLKAGAAFVLLDPADPPARLRRLLAASGARALVRLGPPADTDALVETAAPVVLWSDLTATAPRPRVPVGPWDTAYLAFTSGTTGAPKGVLGTHAPLTHFFDWQAREFGLGPGDRWSALGGLGHDPFLRETLGPLTLGGTVCVPDEEEARSPERLARWLLAQRVTVAHLTPGLGELVARPGRELPGLRYVFFGGDRPTARHVADLRAPNAEFVNFYGTTETPQAVSWHRIAHPPLDPVPIGTGIDGVDVRVLTPGGFPAATDEVGEIVVRTPYLSAGYAGDPAGTADRFGELDGERVFRTGDLGRRCADGTVLLAGRADDQVNVRGHRVEPGEIEAALRTAPGVRSAAVLRWKDELIGYVTGPDASAEDIRRHLRGLLPLPVVPTVTVLDELPLTPRGKLDRSRLPAAGRTADATVVPPRPGLESDIARIWDEVLPRGGAGRHDDFFDAGGNSLLIVRVQARLEDTLGRRVPLARLFQHTTLASLARWLGNEDRTTGPVVTLQPVGGEPPFFCVHPVEGGVGGFRLLANALGTDRPFHALQAPGVDGEQEPCRDVRELARYHARHIQEVRPAGRILLGGWSFGGVVATEVARRLTEAGREVGPVVLLDSRAPHRMARQMAGLADFLDRCEPHLPALPGLLTGPGSGENGTDGPGVPAELVEELRSLDPDSVHRLLLLDAHARTVTRAHLDAMSRYRPEPLRTPVVLLRAAGRSGDPAHDPGLGWQDLTRASLTVHEVRGDHFSMLAEPHVTLLAARLRTVLANATHR
ncbi:amino acid adenylation domain-containing protein [Streptomyces sp. WA6-1-16]|uniref:amino acid adenylation domain-containing protein n=1 Tax=Streptomyces sp. WA6-1-16 TaxID=2879427 RepID=UPI001CE343EF|nr:non-ribosomal peptide synthetase [Streptomyces sp. WA6-1-16]UCA51878.1 amino acid adenylation domain-containing protein [Streptomyces sp. WA6-1-16]